MNGLSDRRGKRRTEARLAVIVALMVAVGGTPAVSVSVESCEGSSDSEGIPTGPG